MRPVEATANASGLIAQHVSIMSGRLWRERERGCVFVCPESCQKYGSGGRLSDDVKPISLKSKSVLSLVAVLTGAVDLKGLIWEEITFTS